MATDASDQLRSSEEADPYAWLRTQRWQEVLASPSSLEEPIKSFLTQENERFLEAFSSILPLKEEVFREIKGRFPVRDQTPPLPHGPYVYYMSFEEGKDDPLYWRAPSYSQASASKPEVILDGPALKQGSYLDIGDVVHSDDHKFLAWAQDDVGNEGYVIYFKDLKENKVEQLRIERTSGQIEWDASSSGFFYVKLDERYRPFRVFYHRLGTPVECDRLVFHQKDPSYFLTLSRVHSGDYIIIDSRDHDSSESYIVDAHQPEKSGRVLMPRQEGVFYTPEYCPDRRSFFVLTNADGALNYKVVELAEDGSSPFASTLIAESPRLLIMEHTVYNGFHVALCVEDARESLVATCLETGERIALPVPLDDEHTGIFSLKLLPGYVYAQPIVYYQASSPMYPARTYAYHLRDGTVTCIHKEPPVPGFDPSLYGAERLWVPSSGDAACRVDIPMTIFFRKDTKFPAPCLLYAYGSYGLSTFTPFRRDVISLVDRGFLYAVAHVRGGRERGGLWYEYGKLFKKKNTFTDFIDCAEFLCQSKRTSPKQLAAHGCSAGGMLMGAVANMRPDLFQIILAQVPFVDVLNTIMDASLPLTPPEWREWGNPITDERANAYIRSYSPYDGVTRQDYPHVLCLTSVADSRVGYWEGAKWVAKLRDHSTSGNPVLLKTNMESAGHFGASGRFQKFEDSALLYAYCIWHLSQARPT